MPPKDWIRQIRVAQDGNEDLAVDEFKDFSSSFIQNYFGHFEHIQDVFAKRISLLHETKTNLLSKARETKALQDANERDKKEVLDSI